MLPLLFYVIRKTANLEKRADYRFFTPDPLDNKSCFVL